MKRQQENPEENPILKKSKVEEKPKEAATTITVVLLDIEGTTTPISFVHDVLFPFVRQNLKKHLDQNWGTSELDDDIDCLRNFGKESKDESDSFIIPEKDKDEIISSVCSSVNALMDKDRKVTPLKQLQGHIWNGGYKSGDLKGIVYEDVLEALNKWKTSKVKIYIYSSGSIAAQKLLFGYSDQGDLLSYFSGHFDTTIGSKLESPSYLKIRDQILGEKGDIKKILFVTDNIEEANAATNVEMNCALSVRPGTKELPADCPFSQITSFLQLFNDNYSFEPFEK